MAEVLDQGWETGNRGKEPVSACIHLYYIDKVEYSKRSSSTFRTLKVHHRGGGERAGMSYCRNGKSRVAQSISNRTLCSVLSCTKQEQDRVSCLRLIRCYLSLSSGPILVSKERIPPAQNTKKFLNFGCPRRG